MSPTLLTPQLAALIRGSMDEVDPIQVALASRLSPAQRVQQAARLSDGLRRIAVRRWMEEHPLISIVQAHQEVMKLYHAIGG